MIGQLILVGKAYISESFIQPSVIALRGGLSEESEKFLGLDARELKALNHALCVNIFYTLGLITDTKKLL